MSTFLSTLHILKNFHLEFLLVLYDHLLFIHWVCLGLFLGLWVPEHARAVLRKMCPDKMCYHIGQHHKHIKGLYALMCDTGRHWKGYVMFFFSRISAAFYIQQWCYQFITLFTDALTVWCCKCYNMNRCNSGSNAACCVTFQPGNIWTPPGSPCLKFECVKIGNQFITVEAKIVCPLFDPDKCIPVEFTRTCKDRHSHTQIVTVASQIMEALTHIQSRLSWRFRNAGKEWCENTATCWLMWPLPAQWNSTDVNVCVLQGTETTTANGCCRTCMYNAYTY